MVKIGYGGNYGQFVRERAVMMLLDPKRKKNSNYNLMVERLLVTIQSFSLC